MPVQTWTPSQILTAAELTTVTNLLLFPVSRSTSLNPCVVGNFYYCTGVITMTLPAASTAGQMIGFKCRVNPVTSPSTAQITISRAGSDVIYGPNLNGATSLQLSNPDSSIVLVSDGTNWQVVSFTGGMAHGRGYRSSALTITTGGVTMKLDTVDGDDPYSMVQATGGTGYILIRQPGVYLACWQTKIQPAASCTQLQADLYLNGAQHSRGTTAIADATYNAAGGSDVFVCANNDQISVFAATSGANASAQLDGPGQSCYLSVHQLS